MLCSFWQDFNLQLLANVYFFFLKTVFVHLAKQSTILSQLCEGQSAKVLNTMFFQIAFENSYHVGGHQLGFKLALCSEVLVFWLFKGEISLL